MRKQSMSRNGVRFARIDSSRKSRMIRLAVLSAAATGAVGLAREASAAVKTWTGNVTDPNSGSYAVSSTGQSAGFSNGITFRQWNTTVANWASGGVGTT